MSRRSAGAVSDGAMRSKLSSAKRRIVAGAPNAPSASSTSADAWKRAIPCASASRCALVKLPSATAWLASRSGFSERWGYARDWRRHLLTRAVRVPHASTHQGRFYQHLVAAVGVATGPLEPQVDVPQHIRQQAAERVRAAGWDGTQRLVTMAPGAAYGTAKRWLPGHFAQVVADLAADSVRTVLVGTRADADTIGTIVNSAAARRAVPISLVGTTSLAELAGILALSSACVSNDSGAMHLAGAVGTPLVALFGPTRESETAPLTRPGGHRSVLSNAVWCRPCMLRECPLDHRCMTGLAPSQVTATVQALLS